MLTSMMPQKSSLVTMCPALQIWIGDQWVLLQMYVHIIPRSWDGPNSSLSLQLIVWVLFQANLLFLSKTDKKPREL